MGCLSIVLDEACDNYCTLSANKTIGDAGHTMSRVRRLRNAVALPARTDHHTFHIPMAFYLFGQFTVGVSETAVVTETGCRALSAIDRPIRRIPG